jgi:hypothetical protein
MAVIKNGVLVPKGPVPTTDDSPTGAVTTASGSQPEPRPAVSRRLDLEMRAAPAQLPVRPAFGLLSALIDLVRRRPPRARPAFATWEVSVTVIASRKAAAGGDRPPSERLLAAAEQLFGERSYHRTSVAEICAKAGLATGSSTRTSARRRSCWRP